MRNIAKSAAHNINIPWHGNSSKIPVAPDRSVALIRVHLAYAGPRQRTTITLLNRPACNWPSLLSLFFLFPLMSRRTGFFSQSLKPKTGNRLRASREKRPLLSPWPFLHRSFLNQEGPLAAVYYTNKTSVYNVHHVCCAVRGWWRSMRCFFQLAN